MRIRILGGLAVVLASTAPPCLSLASEHATLGGTAAPRLAQADTAGAKQGLPSFRDQRGLDAPPANDSAGPTPAAATRPAAPGASRPAGFADDRPLSPPSFKDERPMAPPSFRDERAVTSPPQGFSDQRALGTAPRFQDDRPIDSPSFRDDRLTEKPTFDDSRPIAAPSFRDDRPLAAPSFSDGRPVDAPTAGQPAAPGEPAAVAERPAPRDCGEPTLAGEALDGGRMNVRVQAQCLANQTIRINYGGAELIRTLDGSGNLDMTLDCFAGTGIPVEVRFPDGARKSLTATAHELDRITKVAVIWRAPVNLDLHVFEYAARIGQPGHLWAKAASTLAKAREAARKDKRGRGFLSSVDSEESPGDKVEVYTFLHDDEQTSGAIGLTLDYETRGDVPKGETCGSGAYAEIDFHVVVLPRGGPSARHGGVLTSARCETKLTADARFSQSALPSLRIRK